MHDESLASDRLVPVNYVARKWILLKQDMFSEDGFVSQSTFGILEQLNSVPVRPVSSTGFDRSSCGGKVALQIPCKSHAGSCLEGTARYESRLGMPKGARAEAATAARGLKIAPLKPKRSEKVWKGVKR